MSEQFSLSDLETVSMRLREGAVIAYPTEAVMGLGCDPFNEQAVRCICALKGRAVDQGLLLIASDLGQIADFIDRSGMPPSRYEEIKATWPGPHTWVFPKTARVPSWISGSHVGVAVRITAHAHAAALCRAFGGALVSTSANPHGAVPARNADEVERYFGDALQGILDAPLGNESRPSRIADAATGHVLRG